MGLFGVWLETGRNIIAEKIARESSSTIVVSKNVGLYGGCLARVSLFGS